MAEIALVSGSLPPEVCGVGDYTYNLHRELESICPLDLLHIPIKRAIEPSLLRVFGGRRLVHVQYPTEGWGNSVLPSFLGVTKGSSKLLLTLHEWSQMNPLRRASIQPLVARADGFIFVSEVERDAFLASAPRAARQRPHWVIPIGVNLNVPKLDEGEILEVRHRNLNGAKILLSHFGFIHQGKQPIKLLQTTKMLKEEGLTPRLLFVGDFQKDKLGERKEFERLIRQMNLEHEVEIRGFVRDDKEATTMLAGSDVTFALFDDGLSPRRGSFWLVSQLGCPIITTQPDRRMDLKSEPGHVNFVPRDCDATKLSVIVKSLPAFEPLRYQPIEAAGWREIAESHAVAYAELLG